MRLSYQILFAACVTSVLNGAEAPLLSIGGFVDTYYALDFNHPPLLDRSYGPQPYANPAAPPPISTTPARSNEFNVNLAYLEAKLSSEQVRGRVAIQAGTSVQAAYAGEPTVGSISGPLLARMIQEAYIGYIPIKDKLWIDAGIYLSHIGFESFISKDNWNYSRGLIADSTPYYQSGVRITVQPREYFSVQLHLLNGWQNISFNHSEADSGKAIGVQVNLIPGDLLTVTYNSFFGQAVGTQWRYFNEGIAKLSLGSSLQVGGVYDIGLQQTPDHSAYQFWQGIGLYAHFRRPGYPFGLGFRAEHFYDPNNILFSSGVRFVVVGVTLTFDYELAKNLMWRTDISGLWAEDAVFPTQTGASASDGYVVTSLAYAF